jgi:phosphatidylserine decarboxylase
VSERLAVITQYFLPKHLINVFAGWVANSPFSVKCIPWFIKRYQVNMSEAVNSDIHSYATFNEFFTRPLRADARPISDTPFICPVDGEMSEFGSINQDQIFQAKGHHFSTTTLVGGDAQLAAQFQNGQFANIYLSPKDYHRIHMPCDGRLLRMIYVPGELFSVNPTTARGVPGLFARNERVVCVFENNARQFVLTLVGATIVGSMQTAWHGIVNPPRSKEVREWHYQDQTIVLNKGEEMGRFLLGSTVVMLFPENSMTFNPNWKPACPVKLGEVMGSKINPLI